MTEIKENETKEEKFKRVAKGRMSKSIEQIRLLKNLASANYQYDASNIDRLEEILKAEIDGVTQELMDYLNRPKKEKNKAIQIEL